MKEVQDEMFPRVAMVDKVVQEYWKKLGAAARNTDPETSHEAAAAVREGTASRLQHLVWSTLKRHPEGLTNHELVEATGVDWNTITPRVAPLVRKNLVRDSGERRKGPSGKNCIVWRAV